MLNNISSHLKYKVGRKLGRRGARRFFPKSLGVQEFFERLNSNNINYVVLRWFEELPYIEEGEDIDMLVSDEDIDFLDSLMTAGPLDGIKCDIYTPTGVKGTLWNGVSYYPPGLSKNILKNSVLLNNGVKAPNNKYHFISLAYHAVFHKGYKSGLVNNKGYSYKDPEHDYQEFLENLKNSLRLEDAIISMEGLKDYLHSINYAPHLDTLLKLSSRNEFISDSYSFFDDEAEAKYKGLVSFIVRKNGDKFEKEIKNSIIENGFHILYEKKLESDEASLISRETRGGNWGKGPFPCSGGEPYKLIVTYDLFPSMPDTEMSLSHYGLTNSKIQSVKSDARNTVNKLVSKNKQMNILHSSDNATQAIHYIGYLSNNSEILKLIDDKVSDLKEKILLKDYDFIKDLSANSRRARVSLVQDFNNKKYVCKSFKPGYEFYLENEIDARKVAVQSNIKGIVPIHEREELHVFFPVVEGYSILDKNKIFSYEQVQEIKKTVLSFRKLGYELIDFLPHNIIVDNDNNLNYIDFEFFQCVNPQDTLVGAYCFYGIPKNTSLKLPYNALVGVDKYPYEWKLATGIPRFVLIGNYSRYIYYTVRFFYLNTLRLKIKMKKKLKIIPFFRKINILRNTILGR